jgi:hypothetical protein
VRTADALISVVVMGGAFPVVFVSNRDAVNEIVGSL